MRRVVCVVFLALAVGVSGNTVMDALYAIGDVLFGPAEVPPAAPNNKVQVEHAKGVKVVDFSQPGLPKVRMGARVMDLVNGLHFDDILMDTPNELRPPALVAFYDSNDTVCMKKYAALNWDHVAETKLPARERAFLARYDTYAAPRRAWYKFVPELDLKERMKVTQCPQVVFVPRENDGFLDWCENKVVDGVHYMGCKDYKDYLKGLEFWDGKGDLAAWANAKIAANGEPQISKMFGTYANQGSWIKNRDHTSSDNHLRNMYLAQAFPGFTETGFKVMPIPKEMNDWMLDFFNRNEKTRRSEFWDAESTQMSFTEIPTSFIDLDRERYAKEKMANEYLKPIVEEWSGLRPLELTSFYGMREYPDGSFLKNHVDRIDTHVISITFVVKKLNSAAAKKNPWPLEVVQWSGDHVRYEHPEGTMILYESSKLPHGRPFRNMGGVHVGCFMHFKPVNMHGSDAKKWDDIANVARRNQEAHTQWGRFKSTPSVEPEHPVFSAVEYAKGTKWRGSNAAGGDDDDEDEDGADGSYSVKFYNKSPRTLELFWSGHGGEVVPQGTLAPGANVVINTFVGHNFFWANKGENKPLPGSRMTMEKGRSDYSYKL